MEEEDKINSPNIRTFMITESEEINHEEIAKKYTTKKLERFEVLEDEKIEKISPVSSKLVLEIDKEINSLEGEEDFNFDESLVFDCEKLNNGIEDFFTKDSKEWEEEIKEIEEIISLAKYFQEEQKPKEKNVVKKDSKTKIKKAKTEDDTVIRIINRLERLKIRREEYLKLISEFEENLKDIAKQHRIKLLKIQEKMNEKERIKQNKIEEKEELKKEQNKLEEKLKNYKVGKTSWFGWN